MGGLLGHLKSSSNSVSSDDTADTRDDTADTREDIPLQTLLHPTANEEAIPGEDVTSLAGSDSDSSFISATSLTSEIENKSCLDDNSFVSASTYFDLEQTLTNQRYENWVKAGLALLFTKEGVLPFVVEEIDTFQQRLLNGVRNDSGLPPESICTNCTTQNVLKCPTYGICKTGGVKCGFHELTNAAKRHGQCPNGMCNKICQHIAKSHRFKGPSWGNTDAQKWCFQSWELAKCFMSKEGYSHVVSAADTDFTGLVNVVINLKDIQNSVTEDLSKPNNLFCQARSSRNAILHSPTLQISDDELAIHIDSLIRVLSDAKKLAADEHARNAIEKLKELKHGQLSVTIVEENKVLQIRNEAMKALEAIENKRERAIADIEETRLDVIDSIQTELGSMTQIHVDTIAKEGQLAVENVKSVIQETENVLECKRKYEEDFGQSYINDKRDLQNELLELYEGYLKTPHYPELPKIERDIADVYVEPSISMKRTTSQRNAHSCSSHLLHENTNVKSYSELFTKDLRPCRNIYISGEAGMGKTTFSKRITLAWCRAHFKHRAGQPLSEDEQFILQFEFIFFISLKHVQGDSVEEMVRRELVHPKYHPLLLKLFADESDKCLIILDGLDEWVQPQRKSLIPPSTSPGIPNRDLMSKCTIITSSRTWKLETINLKRFEIDQHVQLLGLNKEEASVLITQTIDLLNSKYNRDKSTRDFVVTLEKAKLVHLLSIPILLKQLVCLWYEENTLEGSQCAIYSGMINRLFELAETPIRRLTNDPHVTRMQNDREQSNIKLPVCFDSQSKCQEYSRLLYILARLSFETLFCEHQGATLSFEDSAIEMHGLSKLELEVCFQVGILSQCEVSGRCTYKVKKLSFLHKTFQEFLAAVYISLDSEKKISLRRITKVCNSVPMLLEMSKVFVFISGMDPCVSRALSKHTIDIATSDPYAQEYRHQGSMYLFNNVCQSEETTRHLQDTMLEMINEGVNSGYPNTEFQLADIFIDRQIKQNEITHLIHINTDILKSLNIDGQLKRDVLDVLLKSTQLQKLVITHHTCFTPDIVHRFVSQSKETLECLVIRSIEPMYMLHYDQFNSMLYDLSVLSSLHIEQVTLTHAGIRCLTKSLSRNDLMRQIELADICCSQCGNNCCYRLDLSRHNHLRGLTLIKLCIDDVKLNTANLETCVVYYLYRTCALVSIAVCLRRAPKLKQLLFWGCQDPAVIELMISVVPTLVHLEQLNINIHVHACKKAFLLSPEMTNIQTITLTCCTMTERTVGDFIDSLPAVQHPIEIQMNELEIIPDDKVQTLEQIRRSSRFVVTLDLEDGPDIHNFYFQTAR